MQAQPYLSFVSGLQPVHVHLLMHQGMQQSQTVQSPVANQITGVTMCLSEQGRRSLAGHQAALHQQGCYVQGY